MALETLVNTIENSEVTTNNTTYLGSYRYRTEVVITTSDGFQFTETPYLHYKAASTGVWTNTNGVLSDNNTVCTWNVNVYNTWEVCEIYGSTITSGFVQTIQNNIIGVTENHTKTDNVINITLVGSDEKKRFTTTPTATYKNNNNDIISVEFTLNVEEGISTATLSIDNYNDTENITITINGVYEQFINIINNIDNTTITHTFTSSDINLTLNVSKSYYQLEQTPWVEYINTDNVNDNAYFILNNDKTQGTLTITNANYNYDINVLGNTLLVLNIVNNIENTTLNYYIVEETLYINVIGSENLNYEFLDTPLLITDTQLINATIQDNIANWIIKPINYETQYVINGAYDKVLHVMYTLQNCTSTPSSYAINRNSILSVTLTPNEYFKFEITPQLIIHYLTNDITINAVDNVLSFDFQTLEDFDNVIYIRINAIAVIDSEIINKYGSIYAYNVSMQNLTDFAKQRFITLSDNATTTEYDKGNLLYSIKRVHLKDIGLLVDDILKVGNYNTNISVKSLINDELVYDLGNFELQFINNNSSDYLSKYQLFLPFYGFYTVSNDYLGKRLNVKYICNVIYGNALIIISCDEIQIETIEVDITSDILFKTSEKMDIKTSGQIQNNTNILKGLDTYLLITYVNDITENIYNNDNKRGLLNIFSGWVRCDEIILNDNNLNEYTRTEIINKLKNGVII